MAKKKKQTKEAIYDSQIAPLMAQIIEICKEHKIAMVASYAVPNEHDDGLHCTTVLLEESHEPSQELLNASRAIYRPQSSSPLMVNVRDKDGKIVSSTAIM